MILFMYLMSGCFEADYYNLGTEYQCNDQIDGEGFPIITYCYKYGCSMWFWVTDDEGMIILTPAYSNIKADNFL